MNIRPRHQLEASGGERVEDCHFVTGVWAVATVPSRSAVKLINRKQQTFARPMSNPFALGCSIRRQVDELFDDLTDRQGRSSQLWRTNRERCGGEHVVLL